MVTRKMINVESKTVYNDGKIQGTDLRNSGKSNEPTSDLGRLQRYLKSNDKLDYAWD